MEEDVTCAVCSERYSPQNHDPTVLPCGHTFCRPCLLLLQEAEDLCCPACRKSHATVNVQQLPCNFSLLSVSDNFNECQPELCESHDGQLLSLWCQQCGRAVCGLCVYEEHPREAHIIMPAKVIVEEKKQHIEHQTLKINKMINNSVQELLISLMNFFKLNNELTKNASLLYKALSIESVLACEEKSEVLHHLAKKFTSVHVGSIQEEEEEEDEEEEEEDENTVEIDSVDCNPNDESFDNAETDDEELENTITVQESTSSVVEEDVTKEVSQEDESATSGPEKALYPLSVCVHNGEGSWSKLIWDNKLLMPAFSNHFVNCHFTIQWEMLKGMLGPLPEVFLEVSIGYRIMGRVYMRLWCHLRRAQHFMALCLGTMGPSYCGSQLVREDKKGSTKTFIVGGKYPLEDGSFSSQGVMDTLEWGGKFVGEYREGLIVCNSGGNRSNDSLFAVCTNKNYKQSCWCPFGEVTAGLEIMKGAVFNNPKKNITISKCGVVLPGSDDFL